MEPLWTCQQYHFSFLNFMIALEHCLCLDCLSCLWVFCSNLFHHCLLQLARVLDLIGRVFKFVFLLIEQFDEQFESETRRKEKIWKLIGFSFDGDLMASFLQSKKWKSNEFIVQSKVQMYFNIIILMAVKVCQTSKYFSNTLHKTAIIETVFNLSIEM